MPHLSSQAVIATTCGATGDDKVGTMAILSFRYCIVNANLFPVVRKNPPIIVREPQNQTVELGTNLTLHCHVRSAIDMFLQWVKHYPTNSSSQDHDFMVIPVSNGHRVTVILLVATITEIIYVYIYI